MFRLFPPGVEDCWSLLPYGGLVRYSAEEVVQDQLELLEGNIFRGQYSFELNTFGL